MSTGKVWNFAALINPKEKPEYGHEGVTIINTTDTDIDITGWYISDKTGKQELEGTLGSGSVRQVTLNNKVRLSTIRDTITILDNQNKIVDQVSYEKKHLPPEGYTIIF